MIIIYFFYGLFFGGLGLTAYLQMRRGGDFPLRKELPWLAAFGFTYATVGWIDMFLISGVSEGLAKILNYAYILLQPLSGMILLIFGWRVLTKLVPLPPWALFIPGVLIVPIAFVITYASTTFITPSPIEIPVDIWSRYLLYTPGSILAGLGFLRQWDYQRKYGYADVSNLMLGAGLAFLFEAFIVGLVVPAAPHGPASYYNYDRVAANAFLGEAVIANKPFGLYAWLDYERILNATGLPVQFWRLVSAVLLTFFVVRGLDIFDAIRRRNLLALQAERDRAQKAAYKAELVARQEAESWTEALVNISRHIADLEDVDKILLYIVDHARLLLKSDYMAVAIYDSDFTNLELKCHAEMQSAHLIEEPVILNSPLMMEVLLSGNSFRSDSQTTSEQLSGICVFCEREAQSTAIVPLNFDNKPIGAMWIARNTSDLYNETDLIWLECIADQVVIAIKHGLMTSQLQSLSVIEERARIAREMHDGLAQVLGYLNLQVQTLDVHLKKGKWDSLARELAHMREAVQSAHADVRENILSLRTTLAHETGMLQAVVEYVDEFSLQTGMEVQFQTLVEEEIGLSSIAEVQLVCILQETLTNCRKHSRASKIDVRIEKSIADGREYIDLIVKDDGVGFYLKKSHGSFGLETMRERAASVGGFFILDSKPGEGTRVECHLPCLSQESVPRPSVVLSERVHEAG